MKYFFNKDLGLFNLVVRSRFHSSADQASTGSGSSTSADCSPSVIVRPTGRGYWEDKCLFKYETSNGACTLDKVE